MVLHNFTTSFNTELYAIRQALYYLYQHEFSSATVFTDSRSEIHAISNFKWESSPAISEIFQQINNFNASVTQIKLMWIPSHSEIPGNETADRLAANSRTQGKNGDNTIVNQIDVHQHSSAIKNNHMNAILARI